MIAVGRAHDAAALLRRHLDANRGGLLLRLTLQKALAASGDPSAALGVARETALTHPGVAPAALALGEALRASGHLPAAIGECQRALRLDPNLVEARIALGAAWLDAGEAEKALDAWRAVAGHCTSAELSAGIAEAERILTAPRSDPRYVRQLFDQFAPDYDSRMLSQLHYNAPTVLRQLGKFLGLGIGGGCAILDLGCGTGLMGEEVRQWGSRLDGVDLSPGMIQKARAREIYDALFESDICSWLAEPGRNYDIIFAADTVVYLGDLAPLLAVAAGRLCRGGHFLFTGEWKEGEGFELGPERRWRHSESYLRGAAESAALTIAGLMNCEPRTEAGVPVPGFAVALAGVPRSRE